MWLFRDRPNKYWTDIMDMDEDDGPLMSKTMMKTRNSLRSFSSNTQEKDPLPYNKTAQSNHRIYSFQSKTELLEISNYVKGSLFAVRQSNRLYSTPPFCSAIHRFHHKRLNIGTILIASPGVIFWKAPFSLFSSCSLIPETLLLCSPPHPSAATC